MPQIIENLDCDAPSYAMAKSASDDSQAITIWKDYTTTVLSLKFNFDLSKVETQQA